MTSERDRRVSWMGSVRQVIHFNFFLLLFSFFLASSGGRELTKVRIILGIGYVCVSIPIKTFSQVRIILPPFSKDFFFLFFW